MSEQINQTVEKMIERMRNKHGLEPRLAYEWEFQLLDAKGQPVSQELLQDFFKDHKGIERIYKERAHGMLEIATNPQLPHHAADNMKDIQAQLGNWAKEKGYHLNANPVVSGKAAGSMSGSAGMHVNSSLVPVGTGELTSNSSVLSLHSGGANVDGRTANVASSITQINKETPLWSHHGEDDMVRLRHGDGTATSYNVGVDKTGMPGAVEIRRNNIVPEKVSEMGRDPFGGADFMTVRAEERIANARIDPHVAAFRTTLGQYHGLEEPVYEAGAAVQANMINVGAVPTNMEGMAANHLKDGSIANKYVGDLYDEQTLAHIDHQGRNPHLTANNLESQEFHWKNPPKAEATVAQAIPQITAAPTVKPAVAPAVSIAPQTVAEPLRPTVLPSAPMTKLPEAWTPANEWETRLGPRERAQAKQYMKGNATVSFVPSVEQEQYIDFLKKQKTGAAQTVVETTVSPVVAATKPPPLNAVEPPALKAPTKPVTAPVVEVAENPILGKAGTTTFPTAALKGGANKVEAEIIKDAGQLEKQALKEAGHGRAGKIIAGVAIAAAALTAGWMMLKSMNKKPENAPKTPSSPVQRTESYTFGSPDDDSPVGRKDGKSWTNYVNDRAGFQGVSAEL